MGALEGVCLFDEKAGRRQTCGGPPRFPSCPVCSQTFQLHILVTFGGNRSCRGMLTVRVLSAPSSRVSFP